MRSSERGVDELRMLGLIIRREFLTRLRSRFFLIATALVVVVLAAFIVLQAFVFSRVGTTVTVGLVGPAQSLAQPLKAIASPVGVTVRTRDVADERSGRDLVRSGDLDALVSGEPAHPTAVVRDSLSPTVESALNQIARQAALNQALTSRGVDPGAVGSEVAGARVEVTALNPDVSQRTPRQVVGVVVAIALYVSLLVYGNLVAQGVVEEKSNRIVEVLLAAVRPRQLLLGKVIGIGLVGIVQLVVVGAAGLLVTSRTQALQIPEIAPAAVAAGLLWFVLGFILYALVYAAAGALVSRQEEVGMVTMPITMVLLGSYLAMFFLLANPTSPVAVGLAMLPPLAPVLMPVRMASGDAAVWQVLLSIVLTVATIAALNVLAARIYANSVLRIGARISLREAWRGQR